MTGSIVAQCRECDNLDRFEGATGTDHDVGDEFQQQCFACGTYGPTRTYEVVEIEDGDRDE